MPIVVRPPGSHHIVVTRSGVASTIGDSSPPEVLLPSGGVHAPAPAPAPHRVLALDALRLRRHLRGIDRRPTNWGDPRFAREVELVRRHLAPLATRRSLAASFGREAFQGLGTTAESIGHTAPIGPIRAAYAIRWLELGARATLPGWPTLIAGGSAPE